MPWEQKTTRSFEPAQKPPPKPANKPQSPISPSATKDDYDAPWEWSNASLSRAFSNLPPPSLAQAAMSRERVDSSLSNQSKAVPHGPMKPQSSLEQDPPDSATVSKTNPSLPLECQWYATCKYALIFLNFNVFAFLNVQKYIYCHFYILAFIFMILCFCILICLHFYENSPPLDHVQDSSSESTLLTLGFDSALTSADFCFFLSQKN